MRNILNYKNENDGCDYFDFVVLILLINMNIGKSTVQISRLMKMIKQDPNDINK
jgi:hypothetical protein